MHVCMDGWMDGRMGLSIYLCHIASTEGLSINVQIKVDVYLFDRSTRKSFMIF